MNESKKNSTFCKHNITSKYSRLRYAVLNWTIISRQRRQRRRLESRNLIHFESWRICIEHPAAPPSRWQIFIHHLNLLHCNCFFNQMLTENLSPTILLVFTVKLCCLESRTLLTVNPKTTTVNATFLFSFPSIQNVVSLSSDEMPQRLEMWTENSSVDASSVAFVICFCSLALLAIFQWIKGLLSHAAHPRFGRINLFHPRTSLIKNSQQRFAKNSRELLKIV